jgi:hypothetical protein
MAYIDHFNFLVDYDPQTGPNEIEHFFRALTVKETGLPFVILVDDCGAYKRFKHNVWLYVKTELGFLITTVSDNPKVIGNYKRHGLDIEGVEILKRFIKQNVKQLEYLAKTGDSIGFFKQMNSFSKDFGDYTHTHYGYPSHEELFFYISMEPNETGLPFKIYVDESDAYKRLNHPLWLYISINKAGDLLPATVCENPQVLGNYKKCGLSDEDASLIKNFILLNIKKLQDISVTDTDNNILTDNVQKINECVELILESPTLKSNETGLSLAIWMEKENRQDTTHGPRVKVGTGNGITNTRTYFSISIEDNPEVKVEPNVRVAEHKINLVKYFIKLNKDNLIKWWNNEITLDQFKCVMIILDKKGKPVYPPPPYKIIGKEINGYRIIQLPDGSYNFLNNHKVAFPNHRFVKVWDFVNYGGHLYTTCQIENKYYYLYPTGDTELIT